MIVTQITELPGGRRRIRLSDDSLITLYKGELKELNIRQDEELSDETYHKIMTQILPRRAKLRGLNLLQKRSYTEYQIRQKLIEGDYPEDIIDQAIEYIKDMRCLDDYGYCKSYIQYYSSSKSIRRLTDDLRQKGVDRDIIERALKSVMADGDLTDEEELIRKLMLKRHYDRDSATYEDEQKLKAYLYGKGFDMDTINRCI